MSLFILMPRSDERVTNILKKNQRVLIEFIEKFQNERGKLYRISV